jgi:hypothetical protein
VLEEIVLKDLNTIIESIENLQDIILAQEQSFVPSKTCSELELEKLEVAFHKISKRKRELYEDFKDNLISKEDYISYREDYITQEKLLKHKISSLEINFKSESKDDILENAWITKLLEMKNIQSLDRDIIIEMIDTIYIYEDRRIKIAYNFSNEYEDLMEITHPRKLPLPQDASKDSATCFFSVSTL